MEYRGRERALELCSPHSGRGAKGDIYSGQGSSKKMGRNKQKQPLAGRDSTSPGSLLSTGANGDREEAAEPTAGAATTASQPNDSAATEPIQTEAGRLDKRNEAVEPKRYVPPQCSACSATRPKESFVDVYVVRRVNGTTIRYCKCRNCGNTFKAT